MNKYVVKLLVIYLVEQLFAGGLRKLQVVAHARVPILKFESHQNISCDVSIDNLAGQMKSKFLFWISEIDGRFRDMVLLVCSQGKLTVAIVN